MVSLSALLYDGYAGWARATGPVCMLGWVLDEWPVQSKTATLETLSDDPTACSTLVAPLPEWRHSLLGLQDEADGSLLEVKDEGSIPVSWAATNTQSKMCKIYVEEAEETTESGKIV